ncbi:type II secretion system protein [uncultured Halovibrio sp.]|uniref:type II secretion system protein n=1 Tax=uncultured Halovibrio sp. TaxID=985049 RepID=UPI0025D6A0AD|nr:type II secretion system protein [uncultured Halovibrio sp.]
MRRQQGFTLTELVMVIVILGIIAAISVRFIQFSTQGALDTANRQRLALGAGVASEQVSRELRSALPGSIRTSEGGECIEFFPIVAGSWYVDGADSFEPKRALSEFQAVPFSRSTEQAIRVFIYPYAESDFPDGLYETGAETRAGLGSVSGSGEERTVTLSSPHTFPEHSPQRRVTLTGDPVSFCRGTGTNSRYLFRYSGYGLNASGGRPSGGVREVVAMPLGDGPLIFSFIPPTRQRNGVVTFEFTLQSADSEESLSVAQEVQVRNVP